MLFFFLSDFIHFYPISSHDWVTPMTWNAAIMLPLNLEHHSIDRWCLPPPGAALLIQVALEARAEDPGDLAVVFLWFSF